MKALNTKEVDNIKLIIGTGPAEDFIDPVATEKKIMPIILKSETQKQIDEKLKQIKIYSSQAMQAKKNHKTAKSESDLRKFADEYTLRMSQIKDIQEELKPLNAELAAMRRSMIKSEAVYFNPPPCTTIISDTEAEEIETKLRQAHENGKRLKADKTEVSDLRGKIYHKKSGAEWFKFEMSKIGDEPPSGGILSANLTSEQQAEIADQENKKRIAELKPAEKEAEKQQKIDSAMNQAVNMRMKLEIEGEKDPLKKSQDWYNAEVVRIEAVYA